MKHLATRLKSAQQGLIEITQRLHDHLRSPRHDVVHPGFRSAGPMYCLQHAFPTGSPLLATIAPHVLGWQCGVCGHSTLLQPYHLPTAPGVALSPPLPDLYSLLARIPGSVWAAALGSLRLWLQEVLRVVPLGGCATPPLWIGEEWIFCWDGPGPQAIPANPPLYGFPPLYTRSASGTWVLNPCYDDSFSFRKLMLSRPSLNRLWRFFLHPRQMLDWNVITTPMTHEFALAHEQLSWLHQSLPPSEALSFCTIPYNFARILHAAYTTNHALCTTGAVSPYYSFHCPLPGDPFATSPLPSQFSFACMQNSWATRGTMSAVTNMLLSSAPTRVILIVCFVARDCWTQTQHLCRTGLGTQVA